MAAVKTLLFSAESPGAATKTLAAKLKFWTPEASTKVGTVGNWEALCFPRTAIGRSFASSIWGTK